MTGVTLYTDASWDHVTEMTGVGYWARDDGLRRVEGGRCSPCDNDSAAAELRGIVVGIGCVFAAWPKVQRIYVASDCQGAIVHAERALEERHHKREDLRALQLRLRGLVPAGVMITFRHVAAHGRAAQDRRRWANTRVDRLALNARKGGVLHREFRARCYPPDRQGA